MTHTHTWSNIGLWNADRTMSLPCLDCYDEAIVSNRQIVKIIEDGFNPTPHGIEIKITQEVHDGISKIVLREIERDYHLTGLVFKSDHPRILDIGAHIGLVSIFMAKLYPQSTVEAYEPNPENYRCLVANIEANGLTNIIPHHAAVTSDGRDVLIQTNAINSGGGSIYGFAGEKVKSVSVAEIFTAPVDLLKIDCEGAEYEIFDALTDTQIRGIGPIRGEFHKGNSNLYVELVNRLHGLHADLVVTRTA